MISDFLRIILPNSGMSVASGKQILAKNMTEPKKLNCFLGHLKKKKMQKGRFLF